MMMMMPPSHCWRSGELRMLHAGPWVPMGAQLPPWCLFVSLDLKPYVTPEGFKPSRHKLGPGVDSARASHRSVPPMAPVQDSTSQKMSSSRNAHLFRTQLRRSAIGACYLYSCQRDRNFLLAPYQMENDSHTDQPYGVLEQ